MKAIILCGRSAGEEFNDFRMQNLIMLKDLAEIKDLLQLPRCENCTQDSNISLANACDSARFDPSKETLERLKIAIAADKEENPHHWNP